MNVRLLQQLSVLCLMSVLLPCGAFAVPYAKSFAAPQIGPARTGSDIETMLSGTYFLLIDKTRKNGGHQDVDILTYEFLSLFADSLSSAATGSTRVTRYESHVNNINELQLPTLEPITGRMHNAIDSRIVVTGKPSKTNKTLDGGLSNVLQLDNLADMSATPAALAAVPVPEPTTFMLLVVGTIGLWVLKRRPKTKRI